MTEYKGAASEAGRVRQLMMKREKQLEALEKRKQRIEQVSLQIEFLPNMTLQCTIVWPYL